MDKFKVPEDILTNRNGQVLDISADDSIIGHHTPVTTPYEPFSTGDAQRTGPTSGKLFPNGSNKAEGAGTINKNGEYGPVTYGF